MLLESARQAGQAVHPRPMLPIGMMCAFDRFVELDEPALVECGQPVEGPDGTSTLAVTARQGSQRRFRADLVLVPLPEAARNVSCAS